MLMPGDAQVQFRNARRFRSPRQRLHGGPATHRDTGFDQCPQQIAQHRIEYLLGQRLPSRQPKRRRKFLGDPDPQTVGHVAPGSVPLIGDRNRCLHHPARAPVHIKLAAGKPAQIGRIGCVEKQQRRFPLRGRNIEQDITGRILQCASQNRLVRRPPKQRRDRFQEGSVCGGPPGVPACSIPTPFPQPRSLLRPPPRRPLVSDPGWRRDRRHGMSE